MCGIAGYLHNGAEPIHLEEKVRAMTDTMVHRGPDGSGVYANQQVGLGHRRLSIIDLSLGTQPMSNAAKTLWITFNGEIYNYIELRKSLKHEGYKFRTHSDTEVLIALYEQYGPSMLSRINGMFAFAIWDVRQRKLFIARDRVGKKPLYYYQDRERFLFASELKALLCESQVPRSVSPSSMEMFFHFGFIPAPYTILQGIHKLLPGHYMEIQDGQVDTVKYWDIEYCPIPSDDNRAKWEERLYELLYQAVERRLISDVPLGAFLSGGLDSSGVVGLMADIQQTPVSTFTIGFEEAEFSETETARFVANYFNTNHHEFTVKPMAFETLPDIVWHFDEPFGDSSAIPTNAVSKIARDHVTVVLSGDGGDELFAGYTRYQRKPSGQMGQRLPQWMKEYIVGPLSHHLPLNAPGRNMLMSLGRKDSGDFGEGIYPYIKDLLYSDDLNLQVMDSSLSFDLFPQLGPMKHLHPLSQRQYQDIKLYLPDDILVKVDRMSMAHSLETRAPLLDYTLVEFSTHLPPEWQIENGVGKSFLRSVLKRFLPKELFEKPKHGFTIPKKSWFKSELKDYARETLLGKQARERGYFNQQMVEKVLDIHIKGQRDYSKWIWCLLNFELWHQTFIDSGTRKV
jgi:asparagine synthase (glutamine-hydrolysing)